ncbi:hypothetical protein U9M48_020793 [Paspalum notatum var. saurae]|uniref:Uncharacterized protein n=1 Tax=Paspalum notatum var. saurae TaxID=547442 RepID=A0AAQ3TI71_PASNO
MNSKTSALNSWPCGSMLEQQVMIFMRQRWRTFRSASHSATKLLVDPDCRMLNTFTAVIANTSKGVRNTTGQLIHGQRLRYGSLKQVVIQQQSLQ